jgi:hypothetical protein
VVVLELGGAQVAERRVEPARVVDVVDEAWEIGGDVLEGLRFHLRDGRLERVEETVPQDWPSRGGARGRRSWVSSGLLPDACQYPQRKESDMSSTMTTMALAGIALVAAAASSAAEPVGPKLTAKLRDVLRQEMALVLGATQDIVGAIATGDHATIAMRARQIHDSFILEQALTEQDRQDLMAAVPVGFVELDRAFHEISAALAEAARAEDAERELAIFDEMTRSCVTCHARFAADRFPGLADK